jgi:hypothetical protein
MQSSAFETMSSIDKQAWISIFFLMHGYDKGRQQNAFSAYKT